MWFSCLLPAFEDVSWGEGLFGLSVEVSQVLFRLSGWEVLEHARGV